MERMQAKFREDGEAQESGAKASARTREAHKSAGKALCIPIYAYFGFSFLLHLAKGSWWSNLDENFDLRL